MGSEVVPQGQAQAPARPTDADNRYKAVQAKLKALAQSMDQATGRLEGLQRRMQSNATRAYELAVDIANAQLDPRHVEMTNVVSLALGGAAVQTRLLHQTAQEVAAMADETQRGHARLYEALDEIRSSRRERTPKPGFFLR
ncbi:hypothetical protein [Streptacidiphilus carbonis]|uniref:hypothetical protein n=1 Tax=Streptacidiphilus carbonis TaxID=105422 RepID=UPI0005A99702|nr:hypothetical protein [Streptacidiphilus carbonis]